MSRLITYFCSFGFSGSCHYPKHPTNNAAPDRLAKHYGEELVNKSILGNNIHQQFASIIKDVDDGFIDTQNDKILVQWSFPGRCFSVDKTIAHYNYSWLDKSYGQHIKWYYDHSCEQIRFLCLLLLLFNARVFVSPGKSLLLVEGEKERERERERMRRRTNNYAACMHGLHAFALIILIALFSKGFSCIAR